MLMIPKVPNFNYCGDIDDDANDPKTSIKDPSSLYPLIINELPRFVQDLNGVMENEIRQAHGEKVEKDHTHL
jgi:hypothetical protein